MQKKWFHYIIFHLFPIMIGAAIYAFGIHYFILPNELMEGGVTGVSILLNYAFGLPLSLLTVIINIPLFLLGWKAFGTRAITYTLWGTVCLAFFLWLIELLIAKGMFLTFLNSQDFFLITLYAGIVTGVGLGIVFRFGGTTGGSDIIARLISKATGRSMGQSILILDAIIIGSSLLFIPKERVLYTLFFVFIATKVIDFIQEGAYAAKACTIITEQTMIEPLKQKIMYEMERGVTLLPATGGYRNEQKGLLYCIVARHETRKLEQLVKQIDPKAFLVISDVKDVLGEGFKQ